MKIIPRMLQFFVLLLMILLMQGCDRPPKHIEVKKAQVGDIELAYYTRGHGDPLVLIMGFRGTMAMWDPGLLNILEKKYTLLIFDNRGVGFSSDTEENSTTISQMAEDTVYWLQSLGFQKAHILGWGVFEKC